MSSEENASTQETTNHARPQFMPLMDDDFRDIALAMRWTEVAVSVPTPFNDTVIATLFGPFATRDSNPCDRGRIVSAVARDEKTAIARMREQALDIARASVDRLRETIESARHNIRVASLGLDAIERESR